MVPLLGPGRLIMQSQCETALPLWAPLALMEIDWFEGIWIYLWNCILSMLIVVILIGYSINQSIHLLFKGKSHRRSGLRTLLEDDMNTRYPWHTIRIYRLSIKLQVIINDLLVLSPVGPLVVVSKIFMSVFINKCVFSHYLMNKVT